jgi:uncharacterized protein (TIGR03437 family)
MRFFVLVLAFAPRLLAQCSYTFQTSSPYATVTNGNTKIVYQAIPASGYNDTITFSVSFARVLNCAWSYTTDQKWLTIDGGPASGSVTGGPTNTFTFSWTAASNPTATPRTANVLFHDSGGTTFVFPVAQSGTVCSLSVPVTSGSSPVGASTGSFAVQTGCAWNAGANVNWIVVPPNTNGTGNGTVSYTVNANGCVASRTGGISVQAGSLFPAANLGPTAFFSITQAGSNDNLSLSPTTATAPIAGSTGYIKVNTGDNCPWTAYADASWIQITLNPSASGPVYIGYNVLANTGGARTGSIHVGLQTFTVTQDGAITAPPPPQVTTVQNAASYASGAVSPGEIISIFGTQLGPAKGVPLQLSSDGKSVTTSLGGTQVLFDGIPAGLLYVSATQVNAVVPYSLSGKSTTQLQVSYQGASSTAAPLAVQPVTPAMFALDANGIGAGAVLNQDYSVNSKAMPATRGSVVMIYTTGGGITSPPTADAAVTDSAQPFPQLVAQPVTVSIGGVAAQVLYSGGVPGSVGGLNQINAIVPNNAPAGDNIPLTVQIGGTPAQPGVTISVR